MSSCVMAKPMWCAGSLACALAICPGCTAPKATGGRSVSNAWENRRTVSAVAGLDRPNDSSASITSGGLDSHHLASSAKPEDIIATVAGRPIERALLFDLLVQSRGAEVLDSLIGAEAVVAEAASRGVSISRGDVEREHRRALRRMTDPLPTGTSDAFDQAPAERVLDSVLAGRHMSRGEFHLMTRRNAYLRKLVVTDRTFDEVELREEYEVRFGEKLSVRHIQVSSPAAAQEIEERLASGETFAELARRYSANTASAAEGGTLAPFSPLDESIPALFRQTAAALSPGETSGTIRVGPWYHLIQLVQRLPADGRPFESVAGEVTASLREGEVEMAMAALYEKLLREASITITDARLAKAYETMKAKSTR